MPLIPQTGDAALSITGPSGTVTFHGFEIPEFLRMGGPFRINVHKQPGGTRQVDSMGPDPGPISWEGIFLSADGWERAQDLYALYEAGDLVTLAWGNGTDTVSGPMLPSTNSGGTRNCIISDYKMRYRAENYCEYSIELTEVINAPAGAAAGVNINNLLAQAQALTAGGAAGL